MSTEVPQQPQEQSPVTPTKDERTWALVAHLGGIFFSFLAPLVVWLIQKEQMPFVDDQGKEALNFQLALVVASLAATILTVITCGVGSVLFMALYAADLIFSIMAAVKVNEGAAYRYPLTIRFIK